jgi:hypothetical protein
VQDVLILYALQMLSSEQIGRLLSIQKQFWSKAQFTKLQHCEGFLEMAVNFSPRVLLKFHFVLVVFRETRKQEDMLIT